MIPLFDTRSTEKPKMKISCELDFKAINRDLDKNPSSDRTILLLQALRWRLTNTSIEQRTIAIDSYVAADLLSIKLNADLRHCPSADLKNVRKSNRTIPLLERLLIPTDVMTPLQQVSSRLINAIASIRKGRNYLVQSLSVVNILIRTLYKTESDPITSEMVIASLQKLSLRQSPRCLMIESDLVEWLVEQLSVNKKNHGVYWLKYTAALLMNLCLHTEARERCVPVAQEILLSIIGWMRATMVDVSASSLSPPAAVLLPYVQNTEGKLHTIPLARMVHISPKALPYLNGALYILLSHPEINQTAVEMSLASQLQELIALQEDEEARCQLSRILTHHREQLLVDSPSNCGSLNQDTEDGKWVLDLLEDEIDAADPVQAGPENLSGEQLLCHYYSAPSDSNKPRTSTDVRLNDFIEWQIPVKSQGSVNTITPPSGYAVEQVMPVPELPQCSPRSSVDPGRPWQVQPKSIPDKSGDLSMQNDRKTSLILSVPATLSLPTLLSKTKSVHYSFSELVDPRVSLALPSVQETAVIAPSSPPQSPSVPESSRFRSSDPRPEELSVANVLLPQASVRNSIALPSQSPFTETENAAELSKIAVVMPGTSTEPPVLLESPPAESEAVRSAPSRTLPEKNTPFLSNPEVTASVLLEPPSHCFDVDATISGTNPTMTVEQTINFRCDDSNVIPVSYTKDEHVVRCRSPENIEVIVAVTMSPDKHGKEDQGTEQFVHTYTKVVNLVKNPRKELNECQPATVHPNNINAAGETAKEITAGLGVPDNTNDNCDAGSSETCEIWSYAEAETGLLNDATESSPRPGDNQSRKESVFGSRPLIPRTPPENSAGLSTDQPETPPKAKNKPI